jgi:hypothetical protein
MKVYKVFIDENLPPQIARGLHILQQPQNDRDAIQFDIISIKDQFGQGAVDEEWIPNVGQVKGIVITQDLRIQSLKHQRELYMQNGVGILFFSPPSNKGFAYWEMVKQVINRWEEIKTIIKRHKTPFAYRCSSRSAKFENMNKVEI